MKVKGHNFLSLSFLENTEVKYQVVSGFVFLRYFAPAILGPRFFDLIEDTVVSTSSVPFQKKT